jgi:Fe-S cluster biogenesis protein NfuA
MELVEVTADGIVRIRFLGACVGCPSSSMTLRVGIERNLKNHVPEVRAVEAVS